MKTQSQVNKKVSSLKRHLMWYFCHQFYRQILVCEFPKSGGTWLSEMLSDATNLPFPRNKPPRFEPCVLHGHLRNSDRFNNVIFVLRDGRDVMVSAYFHFVVGNNLVSSSETNAMRKRLKFKDVQDVRGNLPMFIDFMFTKYRMGGRQISWSIFVNDYYESKNTMVVKYEDLLIDAELQLERILNYLNKTSDHVQLEQIVQKYSFKNKTNRNHGVEDQKSFLRKGIAGDWKNHFNEEAVAVFKKYANAELVLAGYEKDKSWSI